MTDKATVADRLMHGSDLGAFSFQGVPEGWREMDDKERLEFKRRTFDEATARYNEYEETLALARAVKQAMIHANGLEREGKPVNEHVMSWMRNAECAADILLNGREARRSK